jgi:hypothetical protein
MSQSQSERKVIERKIDLYDQNIQVLVALAKIFSRNFPGSKSIIGKPLRDKSKPKSADPVTPDLVTEFSANTPMANYGILTEAKKSFPREKKYWIEDADQLKSYDAEFENWSDGKSHDIILITDPMLVDEFRSYLEKLSAENKDYSFKHTVAYFSYDRDIDNGRVRVLIRREFGQLSNADVGRAMERNRIAFQNFYREAEGIKFYDQKPEVAYTMAILWDHIIPKEKKEEEYASYPIGKPITMPVNTTKAWNIVKEKFAPNNNPDVVQRKWIKEALDKFVDLRLGKRLDDKGDNYEIFFRKRGKKTKSTRDFLLDLIYGEEMIEDDGQARLDEFNPP